MWHRASASRRYGIGKSLGDPLIRQEKIFAKTFSGPLKLTHLTSIDEDPKSEGNTPRKSLQPTYQLKSQPNLVMNPYHLLSLQEDASTCFCFLHSQDRCVLVV